MTYQIPDQSAHRTKKTHFQQCCASCGYDLHQHTNENTCPECGTPFDPHSPLVDEAFDKSTHRRVILIIFATPIAAALLIVIAAFANQGSSSITLILVAFTLALLALIFASRRAAILNTRIDHFNLKQTGDPQRANRRATLNTAALTLTFFFAQAAITLFCYFVIGSIFSLLLGGP